MKTYVLKNNFTYGIVHPSTFTKPAEAFYQASVADATNFILDDMGNLRKRAGTYYIDKIQASDIRIIPFETGDAKFLVVLTMDYGGVAGTNNIIFYQNDSIVIDAATGSPFVIAHPYASSELHDIQFVQKGSSLYLAHASHPLHLLTYGGASATDWTLAAASLTSDSIIAYGDGVTLEYTAFLPPEMLTPAAVTVSYTIAGVAYTATDDGSGGIAGTDIDTGSIDYKSGRLYLKFTAAPDLNTPVKVSFYDLSSQNVACVAFFENRLWLANFGNHKESLWGSAVGSYDNFELGAEPSDAVMFTISSQHNNEIRWVTDAVGVLVVGGNKSVFSVRGGSMGITPTSISVERVFDYDTGYKQPIYGGKSFFFLNSEADQLYGMAIGKTVADTDVLFSCVNLSALSPHMLDGGVKEIAYQTNPFRYVWFLCNDGKVALLRINPSSKDLIHSWLFFATSGTVKTIAYLDKLYLGVDRFGDGYIYLERLDELMYEDYFDSLMVDCGKDITVATATDTFTVDWLPDGTSVAVLTDTGVHPIVEVGAVTTGTITLQWEATHIHVGIPITSTLKTQPLDFGENIVTVGYPKRIGRLRLGLYKSMAGNIENDELLYRLLSYPMNQLIPLFTGWYELIPPSGAQNDLVLSFQHTAPTPFVVGGLFCEYEVLNGS